MDSRIEGGDFCVMPPSLGNKAGSCSISQQGSTRRDGGRAACRHSRAADPGQQASPSSHAHSIQSRRWLGKAACVRPHTARSVQQAVR